MIKAIIFDASDVLYHSSVVDEKMFKLIEKLKKNYKIGLITNLPKPGFEKIFNKQQQDLFDDVHTYGRAGLGKPNPEVFEYSALQLGVEPEECIYIDDYQVNINAAHVVELRTHLFTDRERLVDYLKSEKII